MRKSVAAILFIVVCTPATAAHAASEFVWHDGRGAAHELGQYAGDAVVLHFWASWCIPCRAELPKLAAWHQVHRHIKFIANSLDRRPDAAAAFPKAQGIALPLLTTDLAQASRLGVRALPTTLIINANGRGPRPMSACCPGKMQDLHAFFSPGFRTPAPRGNSPAPPR